MQSRKVNILNAPIDSLTKEQSIEKIVNSIRENKQIHHVVVNAGKLVNMQNDVELYNSVVCSDVINADGQSIVWASRFLGTPLPERVTGIDLMISLIDRAHKLGFSCYFLGAKQSVLLKTVDYFMNSYSPSIVAGYHDGYFKDREEETIARNIAQSGAHILFVAITSPKKEIFLNSYKSIIKTPFIMGVGGSFDVIAGITKRAPIWMQKAGLECFYRFIQEPKRMWKRYLLGNTTFIWLIVLQKLNLYKNPFGNSKV
jgi:N-acetylglucosaminyldiphosphoundecaprenol N-acetyl-beta-D-mannosaminyltransferase